MKEKTQEIARLVDLERGYADLAGFGNASLHTLALRNFKALIKKYGYIEEGVTKGVIKGFTQK